MANQWMRTDLAAPSFPFATELWGRSIIVPQYDQNYDRTAIVTGEDRDKGFPQHFYMENVMPTQQGLQSIGYNLEVAAASPPSTDFDKPFSIITPDLVRVLFVPAGGKNYIYDATTGWISSPFPSGTVSPDVQVTTSYVNGQTYIFFSGYGAFVYDSDSKTLQSVAFTGLTITDILGVFESNGYNVAYTATALAWSSLQDPTDFTPSVITGAGGGQLEDAKGAITVGLNISGGFIVYCEQNAVAATYTGNIQFPFTFREVPGSGGVSAPEFVTWQSNLGYHYVWSTLGLQQLDRLSCKLVFPEASDFLTGNIFEEFDSNSLTLNSQYLSSPLALKLAIVGSRYLVISYGISSTLFTYAIVYDILRTRWGKLKINHRAAFQWNFPNMYGIVSYDKLAGLTYDQLAGTSYDDLSKVFTAIEQPRKNLAFLQMDGTVQIVNFDLSEATADGVLFVGKFQFQRNYFIVHQAANIETVGDSNNFNYYVIATLDGKTLLPAKKMFQNSVGPRNRGFQGKVTGQNVSGLFMGAFNLIAYMLNFTIAGQR